MARSSSGKSVSRAAATGGGTTYRGQMPVNWYAALVVIVLVGLGSIAFAKYQYNKGQPVVQPTVGTTWFAGIAWDVCGTIEPSLPASSARATTGLTTTGNGVVSIAPKSASEAGDNATLGKFAKGYPGLTLTNTTLQYTAGTAALYHNGEKCAKGTPDAGKVGELQARSWVISATIGKNHKQKETGSSTTKSPADLKFKDRQLITVGFVPAGTKLPQPPSSVTTALLQALVGTVSTTTTLPGTATTLTPSSSSTTAPPTTATTSPPSSTTTTAPVTTTTKPTTTTTK